MSATVALKRFGLSEAECRFANRVGELADEHFASRARFWDETGTFPWENVEVLASEGLLGLTLPRRFGGHERPRIYAVLALEQLSARCFATAELLQMCVNGPAYAISRLGSESLQARYLPEVVAGRTLIGISITEERAGSSLGEVTTRLQRGDDGYRLVGEKSFTTAGDVCGALQVLARFGGEGLRGLGSVVVDARAQGFEVVRTFDKIGGNGIREAVLRFDYCPVEPDALLIPGDAGSTEGFKTTMSAYNQLRCGIAAISLGVAQAALDEIGRFLNARYQFGRPLAQSQGLRWRVAELAAELEAARLLTYRAALCDDGRGFPSLWETAVAKLTASRLAVRASDEAIQMLGSRGITRELSAERRYREVRGWTIAGGTTEMLLDLIGGRVLDGYQ